MGLTYDLEEKDYIAFNLYHYHHSPALQGQAWRMSILLSVIVIGASVVISYLVTRQATSLPLVLSLALLGGLVIFFLYPSLVERNLRRQIAQMLREGQNASMLGRQTLELTPDGLLSETATGTGRLNWSAVERVVATGEYIFVYVSAVMAIIVPQRAFSSDGERTAFVQTLAEYYQAALGRPVPTSLAEVK